MASGVVGILTTLRFKGFLLSFLLFLPIPCFQGSRMGGPTDAQTPPYLSSLAACGYFVSVSFSFFSASLDRASLTFSSFFLKAN